MWRLSVRTEIGDNTFGLAVAGWIVGMAVTAIGTLLTGLCLSDTNTKVKNGRSVVALLQDPGTRVHVDDEPWRIGTRVLRQISSNEPAYVASIRERFGREWQAEQDLPALVSGLNEVSRVLGDSALLDGATRALHDEPVNVATLGTTYGVARTCWLLVGCGWGISSLWVWFVLCWWDGLLDGQRPFAGLHGILKGNAYFFVGFGFPGLVAHGALIGVLWVIWAALSGIMHLVRGPRVLGVDAPAVTAPLTPSNLQSTATGSNDPCLRTQADVAEITRQYCEQREATRPTFVSLLATAQKRQRNLAGDRLRKAAHTMENARRAFVVAQADFQDFEERARNGVGAQEANRIYDQLWSHAPVTCLHVDGEEVCVHLETTVIPLQARRYEIGDFALRVTPGSGTFRVLVIRRTSKTLTHPFWEGESLCFGIQAALELGRFLSDLNYPAFVDLATVMMKNPHPDRMQHWKGE